MLARPLRTPMACLAGFLALAGVSGCEEDADLGFRIGTAPGIEGEYVLRIADLFDGRAERSHHLIVDDGKTDLELTFDEQPDLQPGSIIRIEGDELGDGTFEVDELELIAGPPQHIIDPEKRDPRRIAFIIVNWPGTGGLSKPVAQSKVFLGPESTQVYYGEISYGMETLTGDVFGPYEIQDPGSCASQTIAYSAQMAMKDEGHNPDLYEQFMYWFPRRGDCSWSGLANVGSPDNPAADSWYNGSSGCVVLAQELGHNYGMGHSHSYTCHDAMGTEVAFSDECESNGGGCGDSDPCSEYGDPFDPMGGGCEHMNVVQKGIMGWIQGCNTLTATSNGRFNLMPTELPCNGTQALRIPGIGNRLYYLEYRQPIGIVEDTSGVLLRIAPGSYSPYDDPYAIDTTPNSRGSGDHLDGMMRAGDEYVDYLDRVTIRVIEENPTHAVIELEFPNGGDGADPTCVGGDAPMMAMGNWGDMECLSEPYPQDVEAPVVAITYPANEDYFLVGSSFNITAEATDDRQIIDVELFNMGEPLFKDFDAPYEWWVENIPKGDYAFQAVADDGINWTPSDVVWIHVVDELPPDPGTDTDTDGSDGDGDDGGGTTGSGDEGDTGDGTDDGDSGQDGNTSDGGCGCRSTVPPAQGATWTGLAVFLVWRSRRRRR